MFLAISPTRILHFIEDTFFSSTKVIELDNFWHRGELRVYGAERHRRLCEIQPLPYRAPSTVCTGSIPLGKLLLQRGRILTAMGWLRASLKHKNISGIEISQRNVYTAFSVLLPPKTWRAKRNEVCFFVYPKFLSSVRF